MKFTKTQINVIILLSVIIVLMAGGVFLLKFQPDARPIVTPPVKHEKVRDCRPSLNPYFNREINIGGSGNETLNEVFSYGGKLFVFGSTSSTDYDLDLGGGVFAARLNTDGSTEAFYQYGEAGDVLAKVLMREGGFLLAVNRAAGGSALIQTDFEGAVLNTADTSGIYKETFADLKGYDGCFLAVMNVKNETTGIVNLKAKVFDNSLKLTAERSFAHSCNLEYIDTFGGADGWVIAVNFVSPLINRLAFIDFALNKQGLFYDIDIGGDGSYRCDGVMPYEYGYVAIITDSRKVCDVLTITGKFSLHSRVYLNQSAVQRAKMLYAPDGYYCLVQRGLDVTSTFILDRNLQYDKAAAQFASVKDIYSHYIYGASTLFMTADRNGVKLLAAENREIIKELNYGAPDMENVRAVKLNGRFVTVCQASKTSGDCPENFGGSDIWIAFLNDF